MVRLGAKNCLCRRFSRLFLSAERLIDRSATSTSRLRRREEQATTREHVQTHFERPGLDSRALLQAVVRLRRMPRRKNGSRIDEGVRDGVRLQEVQEGLPQGLSVPMTPLASKILQDFIRLDLIL